MLLSALSNSCWALGTIIWGSLMVFWALWTALADYQMPGNLDLKHYPEHSAALADCQIPGKKDVQHLSNTGSHEDIWL